MSEPRPSAGRPYAVHASAAVIRSLRELAAEADRRGQGQAFRDELRRLHERLADNPQNCGERNYHLSAMGLAVYHMMGPILYVRFAVDEQRRIVYLRDVRLSQD